jgi:hypothetical protein
VKKVQRSFSVEYKSGRRKTDARPNSIWGSLDLKSVARDVEQSAMPFRPGTPLVDGSDMEVKPHAANIDTGNRDVGNCHRYTGDGYG